MADKELDPKKVKELQRKMKAAVAAQKRMKITSKPVSGPSLAELERNIKAARALDRNVQNLPEE